MSCECFSSPSDRTRAHRSPMVCSRWGSTSNTPGNWPIHCLAPQQNRKHVYYSHREPDNQFCHTPSSNSLRCPHSPDKVADLRPPKSSLVRGAVLISENNSQGSKLCKYAPTLYETVVGIYAGNLLCKHGVQNKARLVS